MRSKKEISDCLREAEIVLLDKKTKNEIQAIESLTDFITSIKTDEEFIESIEVIRFAKTIDDFLIENKSENQNFEFYAQHKKEIDNQKSKALVFQKKFSIINLPTFKLEFKKKEWYLPAFYDDKLRMNIISAQRYRCALCDTDISGISPHLHHINYNKMNCSRENLVFICARCHGKTNSNREFWKKLLIEKQKAYLIF
jgi:hypothetical protein